GRGVGRCQVGDNPRPGSAGHPLLEPLTGRCAATLAWSPTPSHFPESREKPLFGPEVHPSNVEYPCSIRGLGRFGRLGGQRNFGAVYAGRQRIGRESMDTPHTARTDRGDLLAVFGVLPVLAGNYQPSRPRFPTNPGASAVATKEQRDNSEKPRVSIHWP